MGSSCGHFEKSAFMFTVVLVSDVFRCVYMGVNMAINMGVEMNVNLSLNLGETQMYIKIGENICINMYVCKHNCKLMKRHICTHEFTFGVNICLSMGSKKGVNEDLNKGLEVKVLTML